MAVQNSTRHCEERSDAAVQKNKQNKKPQNQMPTARFLRRKIAEYEKLQIDIEAMRREVAPDENVV